jgi:hypothetical protein
MNGAGAPPAYAAFDVEAQPPPPPPPPPHGNAGHAAAAAASPAAAAPPFASPCDGEAERDPLFSPSLNDDDPSSPSGRSAGGDILAGLRALTFDPLVGVGRMAGDAFASAMPQGLKDGAKKGADALKDGFMTGAGAVKGGLVKTGDILASAMPQELKDGLKTTAEAAQRGAQFAADKAVAGAVLAKDVAVEGAGVVISVLPQEFKDVAAVSREAVEKLAEAGRAVERLLKDKAWRGYNKGGQKKGKKARACVGAALRRALQRACARAFGQPARARRVASFALTAVACSPCSRSSTTTACTSPTCWGAPPARRARVWARITSTRRPLLPDAPALSRACTQLLHLLRRHHAHARPQPARQHRRLHLHDGTSARARLRHSPLPSIIFLPLLQHTHAHTRGLTPLFALCASHTTTTTQISSMSGAGLTTIPMSDMSDFGLGCIFILMLMGGICFLLLPPILYRLYQYREFKPMVQEVLQLRKVIRARAGEAHVDDGPQEDDLMGVRSGVPACAFATRSCADTHAMTHVCVRACCPCLNFLAARISSCRTRGCRFWRRSSSCTTCLSLCWAPSSTTACSCHTCVRAARASCRVRFGFVSLHRAR